MTKKIHRFCKALAKNGKPCRAAATASGLCFFHGNPDKASELGRIGGRENRHSVVEASDPLPALNNASAVRDALARLITDLHEGKIHPRTATSMAQLLNLQLRTIETVASLEERARAKLSLSERFRIILEEGDKRVAVCHAAALATIPVYHQPPSDGE
jgi:hypothetical protein